MKYLPLFNLEIVHAYFADGRCLDFQIEPTVSTQKFLGDCRCIVKTIPNGIQLLVSVDDTGIPFISIPENPLFSFHMYLKNSDFLLYTDLAEFNQITAPLFTNSSPTTNGDLTIVSREASFTEQFSVQNPDSKETYILGGRPLENIKTAGFTISGLSGKSVVKSYDPTRRVITVNSSAANQGTPFTITYPVAPQLDRGVFAAIEINFALAPSSLIGGSNTFRVVFKPIEARWKYYLISDKSANKTSLPTLEDKDGGVIFDAADRIDLTTTPDPADTIATGLAEKYPDMQYFRFISNALIPCQRAPRKNIQLQINGGTVINAMPNPPIQNYGLDVTNSTKEYSLYQIIKYFTQ